MNRLLIIVLSLFCLKLLAQGETRKGVGRFYAHDNDSYAFVKKQLMSKAFEDALSNEMEAMGLSKDTFWTKFNQSFDKEFALKEEALKKKYKIDEQSKAKAVRNFKKMIRQKKLTDRTKYGDLKKAITSYTVKNISRSSSNPKSKYLVLEAKINRGYLSSMYRQYVSGNSFAAATDEKIYISLKLKLKNGNWSQLGVNYSSEIYDAVTEHWKKWFSEKMGVDGDRLVFASESMDNTLAEKSTGEQSILGSLSIIGDKSVDPNSIWIKINNSFEILNDNPLLRERKIEIKSDLLALSVGSNIPIHFADFSILRMLYSYSSIERLSSDIASKIYELPLAEFSKIRSKMRSIPANMKSQEIIIANTTGMSEVLQLMSELKEKLLRFQPLVEFSTYSVDKAIITLKYQGEVDELKKTFKSLSNIRLKNGKKISFLSDENPFSLTLDALASPTGSEG